MSIETIVTKKVDYLRTLAQSYREKGERWEWHAQFFEKYAQAFQEKYEPRLVERAEHIASSPVFSVQLNEPVDKVLQDIKEYPQLIAHIPVVRRNGAEKVVGLLTKEDLLRYRIKQKDKSTQKTVGDILSTDSRELVGELEPEASLRDVAEQFMKGKTTILLIRSQAAGLQGIITPSDYFNRVPQELTYTSLEPHFTSVDEIHDIISGINPDEEVIEIEQEPKKSLFEEEDIDEEERATLEIYEAMKKIRQSPALNQEEGEGFSLTPITFDEKDGIRGETALFFADDFLRRNPETGVFFVRPRTQRILGELGIPYHVVPSEISE